MLAVRTRETLCVWEGRASLAGFCLDKFWLSQLSGDTVKWGKGVFRIILVHLFGLKKYCVIKSKTWPPRGFSCFSTDFEAI